MPELTPQQKQQLDGNIRSMLSNGASEDDVMTYANDFKIKYDPALKKKESPFSSLSKIGGKSSSLGTTGGNGAGLSEKEALTNYLYNLKTPEQKQQSKATKVNSDGAMVAVNPRKPYSDEKIDKEARKKLDDVMYDEGDEWKDPVKNVSKKALSENTIPTTKDLLVHDQANKIIRSSLSGSGFHAKQLLENSEWGKGDATNETTRLLSNRVNEYEKTATPFRGVKANTYLTKDQLYDAGIRAFANKNPHFQKQLEAAGVDINSNDLRLKLGDGNTKTGQVMAQVFNDPDLYDFLENEHPDLISSIQEARENLIYDNKDFGKVQVANEISRDMEASGYNKIDPIFNPEGQAKKTGEVTAQSLYSNDPKKLQFYNEHKEEILDMLDAPSLFTGFAESGKHFFQGMGKTFTQPFTSVSKTIKEGWDKEASMVSADPKGLTKFLYDSGHALGFVASIGATGNVLGGVTAMTQKTAGAFSTAVGFFGDQLEMGVMKYPDSPIKAYTSALVNTGMYTALSFQLFPAAKLEQAFAKVKPELGKIVESLASGKITREAARLELNTVGKRAMDIAGSGLSKNVKVSAEMTGITILNKALDKVMGMDEETFNQYHPEGEEVDTFKSMFLSNIFVNGMAAYGQVKGKNRVATESIYEAATNPKRYERVIDALEVKDPTTNKQELLSNLAHIVKVKSDLDARGVPEKEQKKYLLKSLKEKVLQEAISTMPDATMQRRQTELIRGIQKEKEDILDGKSELNEIAEQALNKIQVEGITDEMNLNAARTTYGDDKVKESIEHSLKTELANTRKELSDIENPTEGDKEFYVDQIVEITKKHTDALDKLKDPINEDPPVPKAKVKLAMVRSINDLKAEVELMKQGKSSPDKNAKIAEFEREIEAQEKLGIDPNKGRTVEEIEVEEPVAASVPIVGEALAGKTKEGVKNILDGYENNNDTVADIVASIENLNVPELRKAVDSFRKEEADDRELAGRGDMDAANDNFIAEVEKYLKESQTPPQTTPVSKVVGEDKSNPSDEIVYHGTKKDFEEFDDKHIGTSTDDGWYGKGFYFHSEKDRGGYGDIVKAAKVDLKNPIVIEGEKAGQKLYDIIGDKAGLDKSFRDESPMNIIREIGATKFTKLAKEIGHDGVIVKYVEGTKEVVAFDAKSITQVKENKPTEPIQSKVGEGVDSKPINVFRGGEINGDYVFVTPNQEYASFYADRNNFTEAQSNTSALMISPKKTLDISEDYKDNYTINEFFDLMKSKGINLSDAEIKGIKEKNKNILEREERNPLYTYVANKYIADAVKREGYDSIKQKEGADGGLKADEVSYMVLDKSIIVNVKNKGTDGKGDKKSTAQSEAKKVYKDIGEVDEPTDARGAALAYLAGGGKINEASFNEEGAGTVKRATLNTGAKEKRSSEAKARDYISKDGKTIEDIAHSIWEGLPEDVRGSITTKEIKDELIDVANSHNTRLSAAIEFRDRYVVKDVRENLSDAELKDMDDAAIAKRHKSVLGLPENQQKELVQLIEKYEDKYGNVDWEKLEADSNGFNPDILSLTLETQNSLDAVIRKNISQATSEPNNATDKDGTGQKEKAEERLKTAQSNYDKATRELKSAEDKFSSKQAKQGDLLNPGNNVSQKDMFANNSTEVKNTLDPLRQKVKEAKAELDIANKELEVAGQKQQEIFDANPEIQAIEQSRKEIIEKVSKPDIKLEFIPAMDLVNSKDPVGNKFKHDDIKERFKRLKELINC